MIMGGIGWEIFLILFQVLLCFVGIAAILMALLVRDDSIRWLGRFSFYSYSILCVAQVSLLIRVVCRFIGRGWIQVGFSLWLMCGVLCAVVGIFMYFKECKGAVYNTRLYLLLFAIFALVPWSIVVVGTYLKRYLD